MKKNIWILFTLLFLSVLGYSQCTVTISPNPVTISCGDSVDLMATGLGPSPVFQEDFNSSSLNPGWVSSSSPDFTNPCGPSLDGTPSAWFGNVPFPRTLTTPGFDVSCGGQICFDLDFAADDNSSSNCEDPDLTNEGVFFQYSIDGGVTWVDIFYFQPVPPSQNPGHPYYSWDNYCFTIPTAAWSANTMFQWDQPNATSTVHDHWGIDNVVINSIPCGYTYDWSNIPGTNDPQSQNVSPVTTTTYNVTFTDGTTSCTDAVTVIVNPMVVDVTATNTTLPCNGCTDLNMTLVSGGPGSICQETATASGDDNDPTIAEVNSFPCVPAGATITGITIDGNISGSNCPSWYTFNIVVDGTTIAVDLCNTTNFDLTPYLPISSIQLVSEDEDNYAPGDFVTLNLTVNITYSMASVYSYTWSPGTGLSSTNTQTTTACPASSTMYYGTLTDSSTGCQATDSIYITVAGTVGSIDPINDTIVCGPYTLPPITGTGLSGSEAYFSGPGGTGTMYNPGDIITSSMTIYAYHPVPGCSSEESFNVTIDAGPPTISCPGNLTATCSISEQPAYSSYAQFISAGGSASDDLSLDTTSFVLLSETSDGNTCPEVITRIYQISDSCGNTSTCTQTITINDVIPPVASNPSPISVNGANDVPAPDPNVVVGESDNCTANPIVAFVSDVSDGNVCNGEIITRTYSVTDDCGNQTLVTQEITILAVTPPISISDFLICEGETITLTPNNPLGVPTTWTGGVVEGVSFTPPVGTTDYIVTADNFGCLNSDTATVVVEALPIVNFTSTDPGCEPFAVTLTNNSTTTSSLVNCVWDIEGAQDLLYGCSSVDYTFDSPGVYDVTLTVTSSTGCTATQTYQDFINVVPMPVADFSVNPPVIMTGDTDVSFENYSQNSVNYTWDFGDGETSTEENPMHQYPLLDASQGYTVTLTAISPIGCTDTTTRSIIVKEPLIFYIPNTFTPDMDEYNQTFQPVFYAGYDPYDFVMYIYNRWGELIFETHNDKIGWDGTYNGKLVEDGTYIWKIEVKTTLSDERKIFKGHVNVIR